MAKVQVYETDEEIKQKKGAGKRKQRVSEDQEEWEEWRKQNAARLSQKSEWRVGKNRTDTKEKCHNKEYKKSKLRTEQIKQLI